MTKPEVLRIIAQAMEDGAPQPISITVYPSRLEPLLQNNSEMTAWAEVFGLCPVDCVYDSEHMPEGKVMVSLANDDIELKYIQHLTEAGAR
jgi:hypothetical protein